MTLKKINGIFYFIVFVCLCLNFIDDAFHTHLFKFISATVYWNFAFWLFTIFFILSCVSLFKKELIFKESPYIFYILFIIITIASFILNSKEDLYKQKPLNRVAFVLYISEYITQSILHFFLTEKSIQHRIKCGLFFFVQLLHQSHFLHQRFIERVYIIKKFIRFKQVGE